ncbi:Dynein regulatory complex subunit 3 Leucine-rich repeat-containing protein 48 [Channa argus]|uniref:Dynein regulatory complex subunit 3 n=1 Tax=Channa argus TaxID=215402 RepID=A0A6G1QCG6_CHAAH|nr:Dynein regulatory complex subunit 3 Leucine-rich repeat-containing protein 48 [Channa argus]
MSEFYGGSEPIVMDEEFLQKVAVEHTPQNLSGIIKREGIHFDEVLELSLEYRNILIIDNLREFTSLEKLYLNNNLIEKIEGLDRLINLTCLNLSFNKIQKIEGLESLQKLEVLNLANNRIAIIENMDKLEKLTHFCIANNLIEQLDNNITLQNVYVSPNANLISKVLYMRKFKNLFTLTLFGNPVSEADDYKLFIAAYFPNLTCLDYKIVNEKTLFNIGLAEHKLRETEVKTFFSGEAKTVADCQQKASQILAKFEQQHQQRIEELEQLSDSNAIKEKIRCCNDEINQLCKSFMSLEFLLVSQLENVRNIALATLEKIAKDNLVEDMSDDVRMLFTDKDTVMNALTAGHDNHLIKINDRETLLGTRLNAWKVALIKGIQDKQLKQHRMRFSDIHRYADYLREQLAKFL